MNNKQVTFSTRLNSFGLGEGLHKVNPNISIPELIREAGTVPGLDSLEMNYPEHFVGQDIDGIRATIDAAHLRITGIQLRWPQAIFSQGAFSNPNPALREEAVQLAFQAVDVCRDFGANHVILWPAHDGYEYPFQLDYVDAWNWLVDCYTRVANYASDMQVSIEFKPAEPRARTLLDSTGSVLALIAQTGCSNLGVTLDVAHLFMARENPALSAAMCLQQGKLFGLQLNDGYGAADDGLIVGSIHLPQTLELFFYLQKYEYEGTYYFDTDPIREDPVKECAMNIQRVKDLMVVADQLVEKGTVPNADAISASSAWWHELLNRSS